jgi:hypothetical protein
MSKMAISNAYQMLNALFTKKFGASSEVVQAIANKVTIILSRNSPPNG